MKKAIIYARVSSSGAQENRQNTERQVVSLTEYARLNGYEVIKTFEEHISGGKKNSERTGLLECLNYAKESKGTTILVSELSRYGRQIWEVLESIKFCIDNGINVYFQKEGLELFDGDKVNGVMAIYISCLSFCAIQKGVKMGRKVGSIKTLDTIQNEYGHVIKALKRGHSVRNTAKICEVSTSTVQRVKKAFCL